MLAKIVLLICLVVDIVLLIKGKEGNKDEERI